MTAESAEVVALSSPQPRPGSKRGNVGVINLGCTCYIAAVVQYLGHSPVLLEALQRRRRCNGDNSTLGALVSLLASKWTAAASQPPFLHPGALMNTLRHRKSSYIDYEVQNDAHEFLMELLDALEDVSTPPAVATRTTPLPPYGGTLQLLHDRSQQHWNAVLHQGHGQGGHLRELYGQHAFLTQCSSCKHVSLSFDIFTSLPIVFHNGHAAVQSSVERSWTFAESIEGFHCEHCHQRHRARRECKISIAPQVLCVHVMRFGAASQKDMGHMHVDARVDIGSAMIQRRGDEVYELCSVVCHRGHSQRGGHYYAVCRTIKGGWAVFDDEDVRDLASLRDIPTEDPYLLLYERI